LKNLKPWPPSPAKLLQKLISQTSPARQSILISVRAMVLQRYQWYGANQRRLEGAVAALLSRGERRAMRGLYQHRAMGDVRRKILERTMSTCQYCGIDQVHSLDHYLPKSLFAEFAVYPRNLVPCCPTCNTRRNPAKRWRIRGRRVHVHFYADLIEQRPLLAVSITLGTKPGGQYRLLAKSADPGFAGLYARHVGQLRLLGRFEREAATVLSSLQISVRERPPESVDALRKRLEGEAIAWQELGGINHWKAVLYRTLVGSDPLVMQLSSGASGYSP